MKKSLVERKIERQRIDEQNHRNVQLVMDRAGQLKSKEELDKWNFDLSSAVDNQIRFIFETNKDRLEYQTLINIEAETIEAKLIEENKEAADLDAIFNLGKSYISENNGKKDEGLRLCKLAAKRGLISPLIFLSNYYENIDKVQSLLYEHKAHDQVNLNKEYIELINNKCVLSADDFYQELKVLAAENCKNALHDIECRFIEITEQNKEQAFKWYTDLHEANYTSGTYKLAQMYSDGYAIDKCLSNRSVLIQPDGSVIETIDRIENIEEKRLLKNAIEKCFHRKNNISVFSYELIFSLIKWLEGKKNPSSLDLTALGQIYLYLSENEINNIESLNKSFLCFYKAGNSSQQFQLGQYYSALLSLDNSIHINDKEKILINEWMESWIEKPLHRDGTRLDKSSFSTKITDKIIFFAHSFSLEIKNIHLEEAKKNLEEKNKALEASQGRMQKLVEQFTHSLGNVIFPDTIYQVAERLKNNPECRKDVLLLHEAYHSEIIIKLQGELLRQRYGNTNPEKFRQFIRSCRRTPNVSENTKSIEDILDYAASRVTARFLNQHYAGLNSIRDKILSKKNVSLNALKQKFEDDILLNKSLRPIAWVDQNLRPIQITKISPLWEKVFILSESHAEALLFGYFSEILFNAFKYADHDKDEFLTLVFDEKTINEITYLSCSWKNPVKDKAPSRLGTGKGLDAIQEDLKQLNDTENPEESLLISQQKNQFQVTLHFKRDLLYKESPSEEYLNLFL